jgi:hypothetical protein
VVEVEIVILGDDGRPDAELLVTRRTPGLSRARIQTQAKRHPATVILNDVVWYDGHAVTERRAMNAPKGPTWMAATVTDDGKALLAAVASQGLPGIRGRRGREDVIVITST